MKQCFMLLFFFVDRIWGLAIGDALIKILEEVVFGFKSKILKIKKKNIRQNKTIFYWIIGYGKYETKRPKNHTMLPCTMHIRRSNKVIMVLLVKLFTCQKTKKPHMLCTVHIRRGSKVIIVMLVKLLNYLLVKSCPITLFFTL